MRHRGGGGGAAGGGGGPVRIVAQVQGELPETHPAQRVHQGLPGAAGARHVQHPAPLRGGLGHHGSHRAGRIGPGGRVHQQVGTRRHGVQHILLGRVQVTDTAFGVRVPVTWVRGRQVDRHRGTGGTHPRQRGNHVMGGQVTFVVVQVLA